MTYTQDASKQCLRITLRELGIDEDCTYISPDNRQWSDIVDFLVIHTPTFQSHLGIKFDEYEKLNNHNLDTFIKKIFSGLGVSNVYVFDSFESKKCKDIYPQVKRIRKNETCIILRCNGIKQSLYASIRNAIAHGNIVKKDNFYIFYSVSDEKNDKNEKNMKNEYDKRITFFLKISKIEHLTTFEKVWTN